MIKRFSPIWIAGLVIPVAHASVHFQILHNFTDMPDDGRYPDGLIRASDGWLYGTTSDGGSYTDVLGVAREGTVFKVKENGSGYTILHSFSGYPEPHWPIAGVIEASDGFLYGAASASGSYIYGFKPGGIYKLNKDGSGFEIVYRFTEVGNDGGFGRLVEGDDGTLYGTRSSGVFKVKKDGTGFGFVYAVGISTWNGGSWLPGLLKGRDGALYGAANSLVFKLDNSRNENSVLHSFQNENVGTPRASLLEGSDGRLYGTTSPLTPSSNVTTCVVFGLNKDGSDYRVLLSYSTGFAQPALTEGPDGALYGTKLSKYQATIFRAKKDGTDYWEFNVNDVVDLDSYSQLFSEWVPGNDGAFYGTMFRAIAASSGAVFKLWPPETPDMMAVAIANNGAEARFAGVSGARYQILRSPDLTAWKVLDTITMPASGIYSFPDNAPANSRAFYRAAWIP
jgi:hypothetical protein